MTKADFKKAAKNQGVSAQINMEIIITIRPKASKYLTLKKMHWQYYVLTIIRKDIIRNKLSRGEKYDF